MTPVARELTQGANVLSRPKFHQMKGLAVSVLNTHMMGWYPNQIWNYKLPTNYGRGTCNVRYSQDWIFFKSVLKYCDIPTRYGAVEPVMFHNIGACWYSSYTFVWPYLLNTSTYWHVTCTVTVENNSYQSWKIIMINWYTMAVLAWFKQWWNLSYSCWCFSSDSSSCRGGKWNCCHCWPIKRPSWWFGIWSHCYPLSNTWNSKWVHDGIFSSVMLMTSLCMMHLRGIGSVLVEMVERW